MLLIADATSPAVDLGGFNSSCWEHRFGFYAGAGVASSDVSLK
jgi:hypothetical protein